MAEIGAQKASGRWRSLAKNKANTAATEICRGALIHEGSEREGINLSRFGLKMPNERFGENASVWISPYVHTSVINWVNADLQTHIVPRR